MNKKLLFTLLTLPYLATAQVVLNQIDDFEGFTTANWTKVGTVLPNQNIATGGPQGVDDNFLRVQSPADGALLTFNNAQWIGNYYQSNGPNKITYIAMDVRNSGSNIIFLRLSFRYNVSTSQSERWSTINPIAVLPGAGWQTINFPIDAASVVRFSGLNGYATTFNNVQEVRILHNDAPSWESDPIEAILDIDNIRARNTPFLSNTSFEQNNSIRVYPNPSNDYVIIQNNQNEASDFDYSIIDLQGRIVKKGSSLFNEKIGIDHLVNGQYIIQIQTEDGLFSTQKLLKN